MKRWTRALLGALGTLALTGQIWLVYQTEHDPFTGLYHKAAFFRRSKHRSRSATGRAILMIDVDDFKAVNDRLGHAAGDAVLQQIARCLRGTSRRGDLVGHFGGDEFLVLLQGIVSAEAAEAHILRIQDELRTALEDVTVSIGGAWSEDADVYALFLQADRALYAAKASGKNTYAMDGNNFSNWSRK